jgi:hypothetical protein
MRGTVFFSNYPYMTSYCLLSLYLWDFSGVATRFNKLNELNELNF